MKKFLFILALFVSCLGFSQDILMENGSFIRCAPDKFYDSGGQFGNYSDDEDLVTTICPQNDDEFILVDFIQFNLQPNSDILTIYDGDDITADVIGTYSGTSPGMVSATASNTSGCLTFAFTSNGLININGWDANIICAVQCQTIVASIDSTIPEETFPGVVEILPGETIDFSASATFSIDDTDATYNWDFGNGSTGIGANSSSTYNTTGTYTVTLTVQDNNPVGCEDIETISVIVLDPVVTVNSAAYPESSLSLEELVENVLVSGGCSGVDNFSVQVNGNPNQLATKSYGYFTKGGAVGFPFEEGIILTTGVASEAGNLIDNGLVSNNNGQAGDDDLEAALGQTDTNDATFVKFNFVPTASVIEFRYLMASEEYDGNTECNFADSFAFLLREVGTTAYTNLAVLPDGTPVSVTNINNSGNCTDNPTYFEGYDIGDTNYGGRTVVLTASAAVTPNVVYEIKLVVADEGDSIWDSAIFLEAGSFVLGGELGDDITIEAGTAQCDGDFVTLDTEAPTATHTWFYAADVNAPDDRAEIIGETSSTLDIDQPGLYFVDVVFAADCTTSDSIQVQFIPNPVANPASNIEFCDADDFAEFDLSSNDDEILGNQNAADFEISYHFSDQDAIDNLSPLPSNYTNVSNPQIIWARIADTSQECYSTTSFSIATLDQPTINPVSDLESCDDVSNDGIADFDLSGQSLTILGSLSPTNYTVSYHLTYDEANMDDNALPLSYTNTINPQPIYVRIENTSDASCYSASPDPLFNLVVNSRAIATTPPDMLACDAAGDDGIEEFDLSAQESAILGTQDPSVYNVTFHGTQDGADNNMDILSTSYSNTTSPDQQTIYVRVEDPSYPECYGTTSFTLIVNPLPAITSPTALEVCDDGTADGIAEMDLSLKNAEVTGNNPNYSISYYETLADLQSGADPLPTLYTNTSNGQVVIVYVEDINTGCSATTTLELVVEQAPVAFTPSPLRYCDPDNDGFGMFDLAGTANEITGGASGLTVTYHETQTNADNGVDAIDTTVSYNNIVQDAQTLYVRVESATIATDCATIVVLELIVEPTPQLMAPTPLEACDDISADGFAVFNLTDKADEILNGQDPTRYILSYYESEANAALAMSPIGNPLAYTNTDDFNQTIWVRVEDNTTVEGCYKLTSLELIVNALPVLVTPAPLELCDAITLDDGQEAFTLEDANAEILNGQTGITLTYYETQSDADNATVPIESPYTNTGNPQTVFVRAENDITGCYNTVTLTLRVNPIPSPEANPDPIEVCDEDNDGFAEFDLEIRTIEVTNGESDVVITYHETQSDAEQGENAITGLYTNIVANNQMIYVRSESTLTGCYNLTLNTLELIVHPAPEVPTSIEPYTICDSDNDGSAQFDLSTKDEEVLNGQEPTTVELTYHVSAANAETGVNPIINVGNYTNNGNPQTIYVRLYDPITTCFDTGMFELIVALPPEAVQPTQLNECDDLGEVPGDEITVFDLRVKDTEITGGNASWSVAYYETSADAQAQENAIPDPTQYTNTEINGLGANPQTLYVVVTDTDTGCVDFTTLTIRVLPNPTPTASDLLPNIERCDEENTGDGTEMFDLTENEDLIRNGENGVTITYHETEDAANAGTDAIPDPTQYTNIETPTQEIYVRMTKDATGCYALVDFTIVVNPLPEVIAVTDFNQCELFTDGTDTFDLSTKDAEVLNGQDEAQFTVSYHDNLTDAEEGMNGLVSPYTNTANPQQIFVAITNNETGCSISTQSFNIEVQEAAQANPDMDPIVFELCDDEMETDGNPLDDSIQFDLTEMDTEVLDGQDPLNYIVTYYATQEDADDKVNPLPTLYENVVNPQVIYARVDNDTPDAVTDADTSICYALAALTLQVNPLPEFDLADGYTLCVNTDGSEVLDPLVIDTGLSATDYGFVWSYEGVEITGETGPSIMPTQGGNYRVDVIDVSTSTETSCPNFDTTVVMESEPPSITVNVLTQNFAESHVLEVVPGDEIGDYEYSLDNGPWQDGTLFTDVSPGQHHITARDRNGCGTTTEPAFIIDYPLYFTPNGDGRNETWNIESIGNGAKIYIFDRYGKLLKQISPNGTGWDGTYNGVAMPTSGYWFTVEYDEPLTGERKEFRAHFTLKR
ncbi:choice-of-anchor L domain-containing protein [Winogradskyella schleiferi]|uniref:choice-of-anchor L domain-containing protein n=1 Tax=Winogradskyella schleiferi TaxID=2686078 RepID=UPI001E56718A|nr:choice-of-anchor L domain-containing protein [Winogradskyella schleiferi]